MVCTIESNMNALSVEAALLVFIPGCHEYFSAIPQSCQALLTALYRDTALYGDTALLGDPCCTLIVVLVVCV